MNRYVEEIDSDLSVFHRVRKPHKLSAPRFLKLARQLHHYDGALRGALMQDQSGQTPAASTTAAEPVKDTPPEVLAKMSESDKFPGIEYD